MYAYTTGVFCIQKSHFAAPVLFRRVLCLCFFFLEGGSYV